MNVGDESQKAGVSISQFSTLFSECKQRIDLPILGAMCLPPANEDPVKYFTLMQNLQKQYGFKELSMGMSNDYIEAIAHGATMIRVGSKILGER